MGKDRRGTRGLQLIETHVRRLSSCRRCPEMVRPVVTGRPVISPIMLVGQAPGAKEGIFGKPFAWTAGKTLFRWFETIGLDEETFRSKIYMAAVCRCFPGKNRTGGDRVPSKTEIANCRTWLQTELEILSPKLLIPVGRLAIEQFLEIGSLDSTVGKRFSIRLGAQKIDVIPLPHPSGASPWHRMEPGKSLLKRALRLIRQHDAYRLIR